jgi:peptidoglycan/LPS O-acetylase OafA/YrhL
LSKTESLYLDFVRVSAALYVFFFHANHLTGMFPIAAWGRDAVTVFFVLSGYVIAYVTETKEPNLLIYAASRLGRIYSIAVPAILLTIACDWIGFQGAGKISYETYPGNDPVIRLGASLSFTAELWLLSITPLSNSPFWSLNYEFWYYTIFGAWRYFLGIPRIWVLGFACLLVGPKILLLFPLWLLGVLLRSSRVCQITNPAVALLLFISTPLFFFGFHFSGLPGNLNAAVAAACGAKCFHLLSYSRGFLWDYVVGLLVFLHFAGMRTLASRFVMPLWLARPVRWTAGFTFSIYLFHYPLLKMFLSLLNGRVPPAQGASLAVVLSLMVILLLGAVAESKKDLIRRWVIQCATSIKTRARLKAS